MASDSQGPTVGHVPPHNLEAEQSVLGSMLINPNAIPVVAELVVAEDFYRETHRLIFAAILSLYEKGEEVDVVTLSAELERQGVLERVGGRDFVHTLAEMVPAATNALQYAGIVREQSVLRALIQVGNEIAELGYQHPDEAHQPARPLRAEGLRHLAAPPHLRVRAHPATSSRATSSASR